ncbi:glutathione S-transferase family protein [Aurantimonas sp. 22II-16-19i]|uniref:glutathione S-transferase family protein n=1 Tax=Aurantimonas sp. 22II-16-19i TaxID=1317114 RepID=UPI0009F7C14F|nr:glutathione S-transferase family protein [Aurantimonas sp. 22II-16-19i]ORE97815.1 glutathione S-transferase [Aurantimonas sp. 22II-16-19i]
MQGRYKLYYNPESRASVARWMLEEVGADYELVPVDIQAGENRTPEFLAINPMGKLPTLILADGTVMTETAAILAHLADCFPAAGLAPAICTGERATYYRWLFFGPSCLEPAGIDAMMRKGSEPLPKMALGWGSYDDVIDTLEAQLAKAPYVTGETFTAADLALGATLWWLSMFGAPRLTESEAIKGFVARVTARDAFRRAQAA